MKDCVFHQAVGFTLVTAQFFGCMPVRGCTSSTYACMAGFVIYWTLKKKSELGKIVIVVNALGNVFISWWMIKMAQKWPRLMNRRKNVEQNLKGIMHVTGSGNVMSYIKYDEEMARKIKLTSFIVLCNTLIQHLLFMSKSILSASECETTPDPMKAYFLSTMQPLFFVIKFNMPLALLCEWSNIAGTFAWNFNDLFIMLVSIGLTSLMQQFNATLIVVKETYRSRKQHRYITLTQFWMQQRHLHTQLGKLVRDIDTKIGPIIVFSFASNCFLICIQMLSSFNQLRYSFESIYFWFTLGFLISRTFAIVLLPGRIYEESNKSIELLYFIPSELFKNSNGEAKRFTEQLLRQKTTLTGMRFFNISKPLLLSIIGTIITYELVLLQFNQTDQVSDSNPCNSTIANVSSIDFQE